MCKTVHLDCESCIACGLCQTIAPSIFDYDDDGIVRFLENPKAKELEVDKDLDQLIQAYRKCPSHAILLKK